MLKCVNSSLHSVTTSTPRSVKCEPMVGWCDAFTDLDKLELILGQLENYIFFSPFFFLLVHHQIELRIKEQIYSKLLKPFSWIDV